jgi:hypothetical protein
VTPSTGRDAATPSTGRDAATPSTGRDAATPSTGRDAATPSNGRDAATSPSRHKNELWVKAATPPACPQRNGYFVVNGDAACPPRTVNLDTSDRLLRAPKTAPKTKRLQPARATKAPSQGFQATLETRPKS